MLTVLIGLVGMFMIYMSIAEEAWGVLAVTIVILLFLMIASWSEREDWKAYVGWREYWAHGRPPGDRKRRKVKKTAVTGAGTRAVSERPRTVYGLPRPGEDVLRKRQMECFRCGSGYEETGRKVYRDGTTILDCRCPGCGWQKLMILEQWMGDEPLKKRA